MAKRKAVLSTLSNPAPSPWVPPPPTLEEALQPEFQDMGDMALNAFINQVPHVPTEWERADMDRERQKQAIRDAEFEKGRLFEIDIANKTGR